MDNFGCKMSKITKTMKKGLQLWVQKVMWAGTQCSDFFPQARLISCQYTNNFAALCLNPFYVLNILISTARKSVIADMPLSGAYNQEMAVIRLILTAEYRRLGPNYIVGVATFRPLPLYEV